MLKQAAVGFTQCLAERNTGTSVPELAKACCARHGQVKVHGAGPSRWTMSTRKPSAPLRTGREICGLEAGGVE